MVDMHIHTIFSDGTDSIDDIFKLANKLNLSTISITDHNTVSAYQEILKNDMLIQFKGKLISGVELKCHFDKEIIELLVYDFNINEMDDFIHKNYISWEYINKDMTNEFIMLLNHYNLIYDKDIIETHDFSKYNGIMEVYKSVLEHNENQNKLDFKLSENITEFVRQNVSNSNSIFYVDLSKYYPSAQDIFEFVKSNKCKIFMPHVFLFNNGFEILNKLHDKYLMDGVECYHPSYTEDQCNLLLKYCNENNLYISAGSDYHGDDYSLGQTSKFYDDSNIKLFTCK